MILSRFVALSVSLIQTASRFQLDDLMPEPYSDYLELGTQVCWIADSFMYMLDQVRRF